MVAQHPHAYKQNSICDQNDVHTTIEIDNKINYGYGTWEGKKSELQKAFEVGSNEHISFYCHFEMTWVNWWWASCTQI